jgi:catechol 2,3-dioxygenase-like lactoylglutathione lyase family enzyme
LCPDVVGASVLETLTHLALEVKYLDRARSFYEDRLGLSAVRVGEREVAYDVGETTLVCRRPASVPRGGLHVHYACHTAAPLAEWRDRFEPLPVTSFDFGAYTSLYVDDPDDHCFEVAGSADADADADTERPEGDPPGASEGTDGESPGLEGVFEVVLEVESLAAAERRYRELGFDPIDRGDDRRRVRLGGPVDLELWEPQLGLADARGAVHGDLGFAVEDVDAAVSTATWATAVVEVASDDNRDSSTSSSSTSDPGDAASRCVRVRDPDGHWLTFHQRD